MLFFSFPFHACVCLCVCLCVYGFHLDMFARLFALPLMKNRMRDHRILMGSEGPKDNILKIRPPLTIEADDVDMILHTMKKILGEI